MIQCASCKYSNRDEAKFCKNCGTPLAQPIAEPTTETTAEPGPAPSMTAPQPTTEAMAEDDTPTDETMQTPMASGETAVAAAEAQTPNAHLTEPGQAPATADSQDTQSPAAPPPPDDVPTNSTPNAESDTPPAPVPAHSDGAPPAETPESGARVASPLPPLSSSGTPPPEDAPSPAIGEMIADRYRVTAALANGAGDVVYEVEDHGVCASCGTLVNPTADEQYCFECGAHLVDTPQPRPTLQLRPLSTDAASAADPLVEWNGHAFEAIAGAAEASATANTFTHGVTLLAGQRSDVGRMRADSPDEDSIFSLTLSGVYESTARPTLGLYVVADGMGGHGDGEVASRAAVETISAYLMQTIILPALQTGAPRGENVQHRIDEAIQLANHRIVEYATAHGNDMGTTLTLAFVVDDTAYIANIGDSRTYLWSAAGLRQITEDHSAVYQLVKTGALHESEIYTHPRRSEILRSLGVDARVKVDQFQVALAPENWLLLCCDGLWEMVHNDGIEDVLLQGLADPQQLCDECVRRANEAGGEDNISVLAVRIVA